MKYFISVLLLLPFGIMTQASSFSIDPANCEIVVAPGGNAISKYASLELQKHLALVSGRKIKIVADKTKGRFPIHIGIWPSDDDKEIAAEEARWQITPDGIWLYGDDFINNHHPDILYVATNYRNRVGTLFAVYEFLEKYMGVRWLEPGDEGISYEKKDKIELTTTKGTWVPEFNQRHIRSAYHENLRKEALSRGNIPARFIFTTDEFLQRKHDEMVWKRRMRMGRSKYFTYGHAFTQWWYKYGETNPEFFALNKQGKREPSSSVMHGDPRRIKICPSSTELAKQVVKDHFAKKSHSLVVNACENDSRGFCRCEACKALDVRFPEEAGKDVEDIPMTDRYIYFTNAVQKEARKVNPDAQTVFYAYSRYRTPPRREKLAEGVIVYFIQGMFVDDKYTNDFYDGWKEANAKQIYIRPNDLCDETGLPLGFEENMFRKFKIATEKFDVQGTDYDTCWGFWPISGITNYIMARGFYRPERSFKDWEDDYFGAFGKAKDDIKNYFHYWRQIYNKRIMPNRERIIKISGKVKENHDKFMQLTDLLYCEKDFDETDAILAHALSRDLSSSNRKRIEKLELANHHSRLKYRAMKANQFSSRASDKEKTAATKALLEFRRIHRNDLNINWELMIYRENLYGDVCGVLRLNGTQGSRYANWDKMLKESIEAVRSVDEPPLR